MRAEAESEEGFQLGSLSIYSMFCTMKDHIDKERQQAVTCKYPVLGDLTLRLCAGPERVAQQKRLMPVEEFFAKNCLPRLILSQSAADKEAALIDSGLETEMNAVVAFFDALWPTLSAVQQCEVKYFQHIHGVFILGILLVQSECSPEQYADAVLALDCWIPGEFSDVSESDIKVCRAAILEEVKLVLWFRDLAETKPGDTGPQSSNGPPKEERPRSSTVRSQDGETIPKAREVPPHDPGGAWPGIGAYRFGKSGAHPTVEWQPCHGQIKSAFFLELCRSENRARDRHELGHLIAAVKDKQADHEMHLIPGYNDAAKYTAPLRTSAKAWRHWGSVPAGHMLFDKPNKKKVGRANGK
jgi:hypothetical protein